MLNVKDAGFSQFIELLPVAVACFDSERRYMALNQAAAELNGVSKELTIDKPFYDVVPDLKETLTPIFDQVLIDKASITDRLIEGKTPKSDNKRYWLANYHPITLPNNEAGLMATVEEITQQVFAKKNAETNKRLLTDVLNSLFTFVGLLDKEGVLLDANKAPLDVAGINIEDVRGKHFWDCYWWNYSEGTMQIIRQAVEKVKMGEAVRFDIDAMMEHGTLAIDFMMEGLYDKSGKLTHIIPSAIDISERKKMEDQLRASQARFENVINRTVDSLVAFDEQGYIQFGNYRFEEMTKTKLIIGQSNIKEFIKNKDIIRTIKQLVRSGKQNGVERIMEVSASETPLLLGNLLPTNVPVEVAISPLLEADRVLYLATISDVSELHKTNKALEDALRTKTALLNEVHHRVKNNLQIMSSLLSLQAKAENVGTTTYEALQDSQRRLKSMALIHELLYEREDFSKVDISVFTNKLILLLQESMTNSEKINLETDLPIHNVYLNLNQSIPYGFLITELITNAYKHAFPDHYADDPTIKVSITRSDNLVNVHIRDNGQGIQSNQTASLGSELIDIFVRQLCAKFETHNNNGCQHRLSFKFNQ